MEVSILKTSQSISDLRREVGCSVSPPVPHLYPFSPLTSRSRPAAPQGGVGPRRRPAEGSRRAAAPPLPEGGGRRGQPRGGVRVLTHADRAEGAAGGGERLRSLSLFIVFFTPSGKGKMGGSCGAVKLFCVFCRHAGCCATFQALSRWRSPASTPRRPST